MYGYHETETRTINDNWFTSNDCEVCDKPMGKKVHQVFTGVYLCDKCYRSLDDEYSYASQVIGS